MIPEEGFVAFLKASSSLNTAVNGNMFPITASMTTRMPFIVYNRIASNRPIHLLGDSGLLFLMFQCDIFAKSYKEAKTVANLLRNRVHGYIGPITAQGETEQVDMNLAGERDGYIPPTDATDTGIFRVSIDIDMSIHESITTKT